MARWAGWGAGPAGAGAAGVSRAFTLLALVFAVVVSVVLLREGRRLEALVCAAAAVYFALRATGRLGPRKIS